MPNAGDFFITTLQKSHLEWGTHRYTGTRDIIYGEGYLQIPRKDAKAIGIYNSNHSSGLNTFNCNSADGFLSNVPLKASGSMAAGDVYAKQFQGSGNLQLLGGWFHHVGAKKGDRVKVTWTSPTDIEIEKL
ncbi:hypothetical protein BABA_10521 [Neobacillus bataviensis LMG 21833]|uniref:Uncharacterized protein n=1 Tax=Neobacillus bataviensis LMG 21833 TaxID=1117379 RepID=K6CDR5_9BACI|nr:hypothetical protein [Neobacillus bataviensis]EKN69290.1 hypothetical protein BABA_10521 [Neobacillus bataviensis LMG 21833]